MAPSDENETRQMLYTGFVHKGPAAVRYPRGKGPGAQVESNMVALPIGKSRTLREGSRIAILAFGSMVSVCAEVADELGATLVDMRFVKPLDENAIQALAKTHELLVTVEENAIQGGAGSAVNEYLNASGTIISTLNLGIPDKFILQDKPSNMLATCGLDQAGIKLAIEQNLLPVSQQVS
jgi:1-deoxy-D-xylulose-5-phosphate synthase